MTHAALIVGYGTMGIYHSRKLAAAEGVTVKGVVDVDPRAIEEAETAGLHGYASLEEGLADPEIDLVVITTPNEAHHPIALAAFAAGKHVLTEKPAMLNSAELEEVMAAAEAAGKVFTVHQNRRWDEDYLVIKQLFDEGTLGQVTYVESRVDGSRGIPGDWRRDPVRGGGMVLDWGVHLVDRLLLMVPAKLNRVFCRLSHIAGHEVDDGFRIQLSFDNGVEAVAACTTNNFISGPNFHMEGAHGTAEIEDWDLNGKIVRLHDLEKDSDAVPVLAGQGMTKTMAPRLVDYAARAKVQDNLEILPIPRIPVSMDGFYTNLVAAIEGREQPLVEISTVLRCLKVLEAAFESHRTGEAIAFEA
ncbi:MULTISPECIES: Gfo/Idh/MocA family protein [Aestuariimicrobium]|uniref:Gfo/Idh/MocA family protein n=1 Tax=Aestuariimicrobium TaxID=396388 RepID=UPI0003B736AF|nr:MULTISPECIES: Gfo/Idh/MocA family oxidoreductase [Aestuariimicrobium]CAI9411106.1 Inositol 2-dehydrogenase/D-chiro-inositol 3-dehydrogenase [Aestuariimicrobium sp. T2.26MG-19.2B]